MSQHAPRAAEAVDPGRPPWSPEQIVRLEYEWRNLRRAFAYHPFVEIVPLSGDPPAEFQVNYKVTTLAIDAAGQLAYVTSCPVHLWLPPLFPNNAPVVRPMAAVFHPNVATEWVHLNPGWRPDASLVDVVAQVGFLLAFQSYDAGAVANPVAMNWVFANSHLVPTDPAANFSPAAGGEPLARVARFGPATLRPLQEKLESVAERLVTGDPAPPSAEEIEAAERETDATLPTFFDPDVAEHLRGLAGELRDFAASLRGADSAWSRLGRLLVLTRAVGEAAGEIVRAEESLRRVLAAEATRPAAAGAAGARRSADRDEEAASAVARLPSPATVQPVARELRRVVGEAENAVARLRGGLSQLSAAPRQPADGAPPHSLLSRRLAREATRLAEASEPARASGALLASLEVVLDGARHEAAAADRVAAWADHRELLREARELVARLKVAAPADIQAYHTEGPAGRAGPFEFEQRVDPGAGPPVAVWYLRAGLVRVIDADAEEVIARGERRVSLPPAAPGAKGGVTIVIGEHADELRLRLENLLARVGDALTRLRPPEDDPSPPGPPSTWVARLAEELDDPGLQRQVEEEHQRCANDLKHLSADLAALGRLKQRVATYHLLHRLAEFVPRARAERERLTAVLSRTDGHLAQIGARSSGDMNTDRLIIPVQYAADYATHMAERDRAQQQIQRLQIAVDGATERLKLRLGKPRLYGTADLPHFRVLRPLPEGYGAHQPALSDEPMRQVVQELEKFLGLSLVASAAAPARAGTKPAIPGTAASTEGGDPAGTGSEPHDGPR